MIKAKVKLDLSGLTGLDERLIKATDEGLGDNADRGFQLSQELVTEQSFDQGTLLQSGHVTKPGELQRLIGYEALHAIFVEFGATYTDKMPPLKVIYEWVRRHQLVARNPEALGGIKSWLRKQGIIKSVKSKDSDYWAIAFFVAKDIKEHGLDPRPFMRPAAEIMEENLAEDVQKRIDSQLR